MEKYTLLKPIEHNGEMITEIIMDLEDLSVEDLERAEREARAMLKKKETMPVPDTNRRYLSAVAARAAGLPLGAIRRLKGKDYTQVCLLVQNFLLDGDSEEDETEESQSPTPQSGETKSSTMSVLTAGTSSVQDSKN